jgi:hypothetical protein
VAQINSRLSRNVYPALIPLGGGTQYKGPRPHQCTSLRQGPALITSATSGDRLPFTVVRLALSLVQDGSTLCRWPGQDTAVGDRCKLGSCPTVPLM